MRIVLHFLVQTSCLLLMAVASLAGLLASFFICVMLIVWLQEGTLQTNDRQMLAKAAAWLMGSCILVYVTWWSRGHTGGKRDDSFRLVESTSGRSEQLVQEVPQIIFFVLLAIWLWAIIPGNAFIKIPRVTGWLITGFFGLHLRIFLHELGHLVAARLLNFELRKIQVGIGPRLWSHSLAKGLRWEWRAWPQGGFVFATPRERKGFRAQQTLFVGAGPLVDGFILWLGYQLIVDTFGGLAAAFAHSAGGLMASVLFWWTAMSTVGGLVPHRFWICHQRMWTDGYLLLRLWTTSNDRAAELALNLDWKQALELLQSAYPASEMSEQATGMKPPGHPDSSLTFLDQQVRLASRLPREAS